MTAAQKRRRGTRIPGDFTVTPELVAWARERVPGVNGRAETEKFINYWRAKSGRDATKLDWDADVEELDAHGSSERTGSPSAPSLPERQPPR